MATSTEVLTIPLEYDNNSTLPISSQWTIYTLANLIGLELLIQEGLYPLTSGGGEATDS